MKRFLSLLMAAMLLLSSFAIAEEEPAYYWLGDKMEDFTVTMSDGKEMTLSKLLETKELVILNFWATWCGPCQAEFPFMEEAYLKYQDKVEIIALSVEPTDTNDVIESFKADLGLSALPLGQDATGLSSNFYFDGIPTSVAIDRYGVICWQESGSITSTDKFERLFSGFLGEDYTESKVGYTIPGPKPTVANADEAALAAALNVEGGNIAVTNDADANIWPFLPTEGGALKSSNTGYDETRAVVHAAVSAKAGDALSFDYVVSTEASMDALRLEVNGELVTIFSGDNQGTYAHAFAADGDYTVTLSYVKDMASAGGEDYAIIDNLQLLSGDAAAAAIAALPAYPLSLEGAAYEVVPVDGKEIVVSDPNVAYAATFAGVRSYVVTGETATLKVKLGKDYDPNQAFVMGDADYVYHTLSDLEYDEEGFTVTVPLSSIEAGGYSNTYVLIYPDQVAQPALYSMLHIYINEENVNFFISEDLPYYGVEGATWNYADGTAPATDAVAVAPAAVEIPEGSAQFTGYFVVQNGDPVANVMAQVCDAETCEVLPSDENGMVSCIKPVYPYEIHVLMAPEGYTFDTEKIYVMPEAGGEIVIEGARN